MSQNPNDTNNPPDGGELDQSEALKRAILKLKEQGMLTHVPDDLMDAAESKPAAPEVPKAAVPPAPKAEPIPEDVTHPATMRPQTPTIASSSEDIEQIADERAKWSAVMTGWGETPPKTKTGELRNLDINLPERSKTGDSDKDKAVDVSKTQESQQVQVVDTTKTQESQQIETIKDDSWGDTTDPKRDDEMAITLTRKEIKPQAEAALTGSREQTPWILQQFFDGEIDLDQELMKRFPTVPTLTSVKFRTLGSRSGRKVATLMTQDGSAQLIIDADIENKVIQMSFQYGSMMTLRYSLAQLSDSDRSRWLELMKREQGGLAFLWGATRWQDDYLICISRKIGTNIYAFSPRNFESAIRLTTPVVKELLVWLEEIWTHKPEPPADDDAPLLTW
jgi:hypothetical protein